MMIFFKIKNAKFAFIKTAFILGLVFYLIVSYMNIDGYVAKKNIDRYFAIGKLDVLYLDRLSTDASEQIMRLENEKNSEISALIQNKQFYLQDYADTKDFRFYNHSTSNALNVYNVKAEDIYKITVINNGSVALNSIALSNEKETQVMASKLESGITCYFFIDDNSVTSYSVTLTDVNNKTYTQNITLDFKDQNFVTLFLDNYEGEWHISY